MWSLIGRLIMGLTIQTLNEQNRNKKPLPEKK
jgi:hypothetical protein